jgi:hypothetical protein
MMDAHDGDDGDDDTNDDDDACGGDDELAKGHTRISIRDGPTSHCPSFHFPNTHCLIAHCSIVPLSIVPRSDCLIIPMPVATLSVVHVSIVHLSIVPLSNVPLSHCSPLSHCHTFPKSHCPMVHCLLGVFSHFQCPSFPLSIAPWSTVRLSIVCIRCGMAVSDQAAYRSDHTISFVLGYTSVGQAAIITLANADTLRMTSRAAPHPSTNRALCRVTSEVERDPVHSTRYGRQRIC